MFHEVVPDGTWPIPPYAVTQGRLREILLDFVRRGYASGTLHDAVAGYNGRSGRQRVERSDLKKVVLTFDDGTHDFVEYALPVLQELNFSATLFIVSGMVGSTRAWQALPGQPSLVPVPLMSVEDLRTIRGMGFELGAHTVSHCLLPSLNCEEARKEIALSRQVLEEIQGDPVRWFAYPYLAANQVTQSLVREAKYDGACGGPNQKHSRFYLNRVDASAYSDHELRLRCSGLFHAVRQTVRHVRYGPTKG